MTPEEFPKDGLTYREAMVLWSCTKKEAITRLNGLFISLHLISSETRGGLRVFRMETDEEFPQELNSGTNRPTVGHGFRHTILHPRICMYSECGKEYQPILSNQKFCSSSCSCKQHKYTAGLRAKEKMKK